MFSLEGSKFAKFDTNTRLLPQGENQLQRTNADGKTLIIGNVEQVPPYLPEGASDPYLQSDTPCGDNNLVLKLINGNPIAVIDEDTGQFARKE